MPSLCSQIHQSFLSFGIFLFIVVVLATVILNPRSDTIIVVSAFSPLHANSLSLQDPTTKPTIGRRTMPLSSTFRHDDWIVSSLDNHQGGGDTSTTENMNDLAATTNSPGTTKPPIRPTTQLFLHFDINETILLGDDAGGDTRHESAQKMIAKSAFVQIPQKQQHSEGGARDAVSWDETQNIEPTHWWDGQPIVPAPDDGNDRSQTAYSVSPPKLYTGWEWPAGCCPYYRTKYKKYSKDFVQGHHPGHGHIYEPLLMACEDALASSSSSGSSSSSHNQQQQQQQQQQNPDPNHILPAFYRTLQYLVEEHGSDVATKDPEMDQHTPPFMVIFRTFGSDLDEICNVMTEFSQGKHPDYPNIKCPQLCLSKDDLYQGRWKEEIVEDDHNNNKKKVVYRLWTSDGSQLIASGDNEILEFLRKKKDESSTCCIGIRDDYQYWKKNNYDPTAGKPIWVPRYDNDGGSDGSSSSSKSPYDHHLFFDDNIHNLPHDGIACVRQQQNDGSYESVDGSIMHKREQGYQGVHMIRVPTVEPVLNPNWYIEQIKNATTHLQHKLQDVSSD